MLVRMVYVKFSRPVSVQVINKIIDEFAFDGPVNKYIDFVDKKLGSVRDMARRVKKYHAVGLHQVGEVFLADCGHFTFCDCKEVYR